MAVFYIDPDFEKLTTTGLNDFHGGHARQHREEMRQIADEEIKRLVPQMATEIYNNAVSKLVGAIQYDVDTCVSVALSSAGEIYNDRKFKKVLSDAIMKQIKAQLGDLHFKI